MTQEHSFIGPRDVRPLQLKSAEGYQDLARLGICMDEKHVMKMAQEAPDAIVGDSIQGLTTTASITTPIQFLQQWLPGFVNVLTQARKIDDLVGISTSGKWSDEQVVQGIMELTGTAMPYGDYTDIPLGSWNSNFETRTVVRFEEGLRVGVLEEDRTGRMNVNSGAQKRSAAAMALDIVRNRVGFYGFNNGLGRTYGFLNDPGLGSYVSNPGPEWSAATFLEIVADLRAAFIALRTQSGDQINANDTPITLAIASNCVDYLSVMNVQGTQSVTQWLNATYPKVRVVSAPELNNANGNANVFYAYAENVPDSGSDDGRTWVQVVPAKFQVVGVEKRAKAYLEDYTNATAGVFLKRPYAVVRYTGI